ncbi:pyruvate dehydrogenase (acetyl-transferring) E1 component subunit alpha [Candidatus Micrarchaeota archaeon]|nr:pyruvate dehydrogenase (acetyl-transferring) E1 component subunit alpha [Candidatus Micrarchaeota archaeon]
MPIETVFEGKVKYIQVIDKDGNADEKLDPKLPKDLLLRMYITMVVTRMFDDKALKLQRQGRIYTYPPCLGQEAAQIGSIAALNEEDWFFPSYREHGGYLWRGTEMKWMFVYLMGSELGMKIPEGKHNFLVSIPIATQTLHAVGAAWAAKILNHKVATMVYFGDGATSEGDFHEAMNFAGVFKTPTVFLNQNNQWAISVPRKKQTAAKTIAQKALAYGFEGVQVDGNDVLAVYRATKEAIDKAHRGEGPTLIEALTYRMSHHTTADDWTKYRDSAEVEQWKERDPVKRFRIYLERNGYWNEDLEKKTVERATSEIEKAIEEAESMKLDNPEDVFMYTYSKMPPHLVEQMNELMEYLKNKS